jgi:sulfite reductase subunit B
MHTSEASMKNIYLPFPVTLEEIIEESATIKTFRFKDSNGFRFQTGQFVELALAGMGEAPFTPSSDPNIAGQFEITIMRVGRVTEALHNLSAPQTLGVRGPFGKGYPLDDFKGRQILIVGGGVGLAPLRSLILALFAQSEDFKKIHLRFGARTPSDLIYKQELETWKKKCDCLVTVDKAESGWKGHVGLVTTILDTRGIDMKDTAVIVCGPPIMMKFSTFKLLELGFKPEQIYLSMEKNMSCGLGKCGHCRVGPFFVCRDGPVFTYDKLKDLHEVWD